MLLPMTFFIVVYRVVVNIGVFAIGPFLDKVIYTQFNFGSAIIKISLLLRPQ